MGKTKTSLSGTEGFTLLELLIVLALFLAVATIAVPRLDSMVGGMSFKDTALRLKAAIRLGRLTAIREGKAILIRPMNANTGVSIGNKELGFRGDTVLVHLGVEGHMQPDEERVIRLYPDGSADHGRIILQGHQKRVSIVIHPLLGKVDLEWH